MCQASETRFFFLTWGEIVDTALLRFISDELDQTATDTPTSTAAQQISTSHISTISTMAETEGSTILDASVAGPTHEEANAAASSLHLQAEIPGPTDSSRKKKKRKVNRAEAATAAKKKSKAVTNRDLPEGVTETSAGKFSALIQWGGKSRSIGTFATPEKASAACWSVKKGLDDAKLSAVGAHKVNNVFEAAKTIASEVYGGMPEPGLPQGVTKIFTGRFVAKISSGGKERHIGTFVTPEQASDAFLSVKKDLGNAQISAIGPDEVNEAFVAAKTKAIEVYGGIKRGQTKRKSKSGFIDLTGVPPQPLILKNQLGHTLYSDNSRRRPTKEGSSKYTGIHFDAKWSKWKAQIMVEGKVRAIGYYDKEEDAAADYARAAYKYKKRKRNSNVHGGLDLSGVPESLPLIRKEGTATGFVGVKKHKQRKKFEARITIGKKPTTLGSFDTPKEAALIYARAKWYLESKAQGKKEGTKESSGLVEEPSGSYTGLVAGSEVTVDEKGGNGGDGRDVDHDHLDNAHDEDPVDRSYMSDIDYSEVDGVAV